MNNCEQLKSNAFAWLNKQIKADRMMKKSFHEEVSNITPSSFKQIHISGLIKVSEITGIPYKRIGWDGNEHCKTNHDEVFFYYKGYKFFQLIDKDKE